MRALTVTVVVVLLTVWCGGLWAQNLLKDPSFDNTQLRSRYGLVFKDWGGNVYEGASRFEVGQVAHSGKTSCLIVGDIGGKIRLISNPINVEPGRYRVQAYLRGMDIGPGRYGKVTVEFMTQMGPGVTMKKLTGTFGWTPMTYVFDYTEGGKPPQLHFGLYEDGMLWIDDVTMEKVGEEVALTPEVELGPEEGPIAPPGPLTDPIHCPTCGYRNNVDGKVCYACGADLGAAKQTFGSPAVKMIADFEAGNTRPFEGGAVETEKPIDGNGSLTLGKGYISIGTPQDWSEHDYLVFDTFNQSENAAVLGIEIRDDQTRDYWTRVNMSVMVPPGRGSVSMPTAVYVGEKSRPGRPLIRNKVTRFVVNNQSNASVVFDNFRLERLDTQEVLFNELLAFDFGPNDGPLMEGFTRGVTSMPYSLGRGYGWTKTGFWRTFNVLQPEALTQDFVTPTNAVFRMDVPNGKYHVMMIIDSPGGYWGEAQRYRQRQVLANGQEAVSETMDLETFKNGYFRNAHREDLPGLDTFNEYVQQMLPAKHFEVEVTDGKIELEFKGQDWALCLSALVVYPEVKSQQGEKFLTWVTERRRKQFENYFHQVPVTRTGAETPTTGMRLFMRKLANPANAYDGPREGEEIPVEGLTVTLAQGEEGMVTFVVQPAADAGAINVEVSPLRNAGITLDPAGIRPGWLDYRITRQIMDGSVYSVRPRYWHPAPAPAAAVTRNIWIRTQISETAQPGKYTGTISVRPEQGPAQQVKLTVEVLPFQLDPVMDVAVGPWGSGIHLQWFPNDPEVGNWNWTMFEKALDVLKTDGFTSFSGRPSGIGVQVANGQVTLNTGRADQEMELIRKKGFNQLISNYMGGGIGLYQLYNGITDADAKKKGFVSAEELLKAVWKAIDDHAVEKDWVPIAWNLCDEPVGNDIANAVKNAQAHRKAGEGLKRTTFMGATSMEGNDPKNPHYELVRGLLVPSLNGHDEASLQVVKDAGNKFSFYNGGNRWTYGRYMKFLVVKHGMALRLSWHYNVVAGDPYYALDCREDDYCWYNTDAGGELIPSVQLLQQMKPGVTDYRYFSTLERLLKEKPKHPAASEARKTWDELMNLEAGKNRGGGGTIEEDRQKTVQAILSLLK